MMLHAAKKFSAPALRGDSTSAARQLGARAFVSASKVATPDAANKGYGVFSSVGTKTKTSFLRAFGGGNNLADALARVNHADSFMGVGFGSTGSGAAIAGGGTVGRAPPGNPSTMAFLGVRAKSSGAAFRVNAAYDEDEYDVAVGGGRSHQEAWMVNLGRGDDEWLSKPRTGEWFTGLEPNICPGEFIR